MASVRIGIVGLGTIGKAHWKVIRESSETTLVAISDPTPSALEFARAENVPAYADYRDMLEKEKLDGVVVAVPNAQHVPVSLACIERGIPVLVEKPVADEVEAARGMCRVAEARNVPVLVGTIAVTIPPCSVCVRPLVTGSLDDRSQRQSCTIN